MGPAWARRTEPGSTNAGACTATTQPTRAANFCIRLQDSCRSIVREVVEIPDQDGATALDPGMRFQCRQGILSLADAEAQPRIVAAAPKHHARGERFDETGPAGKALSSRSYRPPNRARR